MLLRLLRLLLGRFEEGWLDFCTFSLFFAVCLPFFVSLFLLLSRVRVLLRCLGSGSSRFTAKFGLFLFVLSFRVRASKVDDRERESSKSISERRNEAKTNCEATTIQLHFFRRKPKVHGCIVGRGDGYAEA